MADDARIEQGRCFERVLVKKIRTDQIALCLCQDGMGLQCVFHLDSTRFENLEQVPVTAFEVFEHILQLLFGSVRLEPQNPVDNMIGARLVGRIEVPGSIAGLKGRTTTLAGSGRRYKVCRFKNMG